MNDSSSDDVNKIHKRYSLTLFTPSSYFLSLGISVLVVSVLVATAVFGYLGDDDFILRILLVIPVLLATQYIDSRFTKNKEFSKTIHMSMFGNLLWLLTILVGLLSFLVLSRAEPPIIFVTEGLFIFASFRIGIFTTVLGLSLRKACLICFFQPLLMFFALIPISLWQESLLNPQALGYGSVFVIVAIVWSILTDRAGRPGISSTHKLLQSYLTSISKNDTANVESVMEERSKPSTVSTSQIKFKTKSIDFRMILPDIHPGPFHPVGGSNIPYLIYKNMNSSAMVMHSVSDHSLNLPSQQQVENYLQSLVKCKVTQQGQVCTEPVTVQVNMARVVGLLFGKTAVLFLSLSPHGMEDLPLHLKTEIEQYSTNRGFDNVLIVDCHNAMGEHISQNNLEDLLKASKSSLDVLIKKPNYPLEIGYGNSKDMNLKTLDLGLGGIGVLCLKINGQKYFLGWADANNMENGVREKVVNHFSKNGYNLLEICTSDTHYSSEKVRNSNGYYQFGVISNPQEISDWFFTAANNAENNLEQATYEILENESKVKVMGPNIYRDFSRALDNSMKLTKGFLIGSLAFFLVTMFL